MNATIQETLCFLGDSISGVSLYTVCEMWRLDENIKEERLQQAFVKVICASDKLRSVFFVDENSLLCRRYGVNTNARYWLADDVELNMLEYPLIVGGIESRGGYKIFKVQFHHALMDAWSLGLFMQDLSNVYCGKPVSFVNDNTFLNRSQEISPLERKWEEYGFIQRKKINDDTSVGEILHLSCDEVSAIQRKASLLSVSLFSVLINMLSKILFRMDLSKTCIEYAIPFFGRSVEEANVIDMMVNTQILSVQDENPRAIHKQLLSLIKSPKSGYDYRGTPAIMVNFLDDELCRFPILKHQYPISYVRKYSIYDLTVEFRKKGGMMDVIVYGKRGSVSVETIKSIVNHFQEESQACLKESQL